MSYRAAFLIGVAGVVLHTSFLFVLPVLAGYWVFEWLDKWLERRRVKREREKVFADECDDWKVYADDPTQEISSDGEFLRVKLVGHEQVIVTRILAVLRRLPY